jgi:hypothetical protein
LRQKDAENQRSKDLQAVIFDLEAKVRAREDQISITRKEGDDVKFSNAGITDRNSQIRAEIAAL